MRVMVCVSCDPRYGRRVQTVTREPQAADAGPPTAPDVDAELRKAIRQACAEAKRHQTDVATAAGLSWPQWMRRMSNTPTSRSRWTVDEVRRVADVLGVPVGELIGEDAQR